MSLVIFIVMIAYTIFLINFTIERRGSNTTVSTQVNDLSVDPDTHQPGLNNFRFGMGISDSQGQLFYNESYFRFVVVQGNVSRDGLSLDFNGYIVETKE